MTSNQIRFRVPDMSCAHCITTITGVLEQAIEGARVEADLKQHLVTVSSTTDLETITALLANEDYTVEPL